CLFRTPARPETYTLSLHDALPIFRPRRVGYPRLMATKPLPDQTLAMLARGYEYGTGVRRRVGVRCFRTRILGRPAVCGIGEDAVDRKSTRLNSSHVKISYAVFCLK